MLLVFGSVNLDIAFSAARLPLAGETVMGSGYLVSPGGKGANQAHAARLFGAPVTLAAAVGRDAFAESALAQLAGAGVDLAQVQWLDAPTGCAGIVVDAQAENQIVVAAGANHLVTPEQLPARIESPLIVQLLRARSQVDNFTQLQTRQDELRAAWGDAFDPPETKG